jgi:pantoate--beta-alanine ligase
MSSRNALLTTEERGKAAVLSRLLGELAGAIGSGEGSGPAIERCIGQLRANGFGPVDYVAYVNEDSLEPLESYEDGGRLIAAAFLGNVRLIDNIRVISDTV